MKSATLKDVLYALEYGQAKLCRWPSRKPGSKPTWSIEPGGMKVPSGIADQARANAGVVLSSATRFGEDAFVWRDAA